MRRSFVARAVVVLVVVAAGVLTWLLFLAGGTGEPSTELPTPTFPDSTTTSGSSATTVASSGDGPGLLVFVIDSSQSTATYEIREVLRGSPNLVVGTTDQIAGQVQVDPEHLSSVVFSQLVVNARTFETDSPRRDQAVRGPIILDSGSDEHEFITLDVTAVDGLGGSIGVGDTAELTITGDLTIRGTTVTQTFTVSVTYVDASTIRGTARTTVLRSDYAIGIPSVPGVADVADEVVLKLDFTARSELS